MSVLSRGGNTSWPRITVAYARRQSASVSTGRALFVLRNQAQYETLLVIYRGAETNCFHMSYTIPTPHRHTCCYCYAIFIVCKVKNSKVSPNNPQYRPAPVTIFSRILLQLPWDEISHGAISARRISYTTINLSIEPGRVIQLSEME